VRRPHGDLVLSGRVVDAREALRIGLAEAVRPDEGFLEHALAHARGLAVGPSSRPSAP
jgi:enoyl-CoA hydratase/carnithine racemase